MRGSNAAVAARESAGWTRSAADGAPPESGASSFDGRPLVKRLPSVGLRPAIVGTSMEQTAHR